ncbi:MAG: hypothetical protein ACLSAH_04755 [Bilophila wadsworthia]
MLQHGDSSRRPRQHDDHLAGRRPHAAARRGPDVVGEDGRALGQHGLLRWFSPIAGRPLK